MVLINRDHCDLNAVSSSIIDTVSNWSMSSDVFSVRCSEVVYTNASETCRITANILCLAAEQFPSELEYGQ